MASYNSNIYGSSSHITNRERQVLLLVAHEFSTKEIAQRLFISTQTVISHRKKIMQKLGVKNAAGMIRVAFEKDILSLEEKT